MLKKTMTMGIKPLVAAVAAMALAAGVACAQAYPANMDTPGSGSESSPPPVIVVEPEKVTDLAKADITVEDQTFTGFELMPEVTVELGGLTLAEGTDYTLAYEDNIDIGEATVTVTAAGEYKGSASVNFTIEPHPQGWDIVEDTYFYYGDEGTILTESFAPGTDGAWFYVGKYGTVVKGAWVYHNGRLYYIDASGHPVTNGWATYGNMYFFMGDNGNPVKNSWINAGGKHYYLDSDGVMVTGLQTIDGEAYIFNDDGSLRYISNNERLDRIVCRLIRDTTGFDTRVAYDYVARSFTYERQPIDTSFKDWEEQYALDLVDKGIGNCYNYSALYNFLLRAMGYDCKTIDGICSDRSDGKFYHHSWVEVYMDGGVYVCDPVLERYNGSNIPSYFITYADNAAATTWLVYELDWNGYPELSPQYP